MAKRGISQCKTSDEFLKLARKQANIREGGRHSVVYNDLGQCAIPRHKGDLPTGTRCSIAKTLKLMGLTLLVFVLLVVLLYFV